MAENIPAIRNFWGNLDTYNGNQSNLLRVQRVRFGRVTTAFKAPSTYPIWTVQPLVYLASVLDTDN